MPIKIARRKRLDDIEDPKERETGDERNPSDGNEEHRRDHAEHFIDHDTRTVLLTKKLLRLPGDPAGRDKDDHESYQEGCGPFLSDWRDQAGQNRSDQRSGCPGRDRRITRPCSGGEKYDDLAHLCGTANITCALSATKVRCSYLP